MSQFLDSVRVINVLAASNSASAVPTRADPTDTASPAVTVSPDGTTRVYKHSGGSEFLAVPICAIVFTFIYLIIKAIMAPFTQRAKYARSMPQGGGGGLTQEEIAVLQKLQRTLTQMESRVEALETILIETARTEKKYGSKL